MIIDRKLKSSHKKPSELQCLLADTLARFRKEKATIERNLTMPLVPSPGFIMACNSNILELDALIARTEEALRNLT